MVNPRMNQCLAQLNEAEFESLAPHLRLVSLAKGRVLYEPGERIKKFHFPVTAKLVIAASYDPDHFSDIVLVGAEGMIGRRLLIDGISSHRVYVSVPGFAYEISASPMLHEFRKFSGVHDICMAAIENMMVKISNEIICSRFHSLEQRLAKWLLLRLDEDNQSDIKTTHQDVANSLGYKREAISIALGKFRCIELSRGKIHVNDRGYLERSVCSCYVVPPQRNNSQLGLWQDRAE